MEFLVSLGGREGDQRAVPAGPQASAHPSAVVPTPSLALQPSRQCDELPNFLLKPPCSLEGGSLRSGAPGRVSSEASLLGVGKASSPCLPTVSSLSLCPILFCYECVRWEHQTAF